MDHYVDKLLVFIMTRIYINRLLKIGVYSIFYSSFKTGLARNCIYSRTFRS